MSSRYRCTSCGNLTRFDVTTTRRTRAFHHFTIGGDLAVEDEQVLEQTVESVACRWCGSGAGVVELQEGDAGLRDPNAETGTDTGTPSSPT